MFFYRFHKFSRRIILILTIIVILVDSSCQTMESTSLAKSSSSSSFLKSTEKKFNNYLPEAKFGYNEYAEYTDGNDDDDKSRHGPRPPQLQNRKEASVTRDNKSQSTDSTNSISSLKNNNQQQSIKWDKKWDEEVTSNFKFGQVSAVSVDPDGNVVVFHRGDRIWGTGTFDSNEVFDKARGPIVENVIVVIDAISGKPISEWGKNTFYLPHGLNVDSDGNYWITDVAMHQVFKYEAKDLLDFMNKNKINKEDRDNLLNDIRIAPSMILGEAFAPGNDNKKFCKPTSVAVEKQNGDFFVSDGYCNSRIIKFNYKGERILTWGRKPGFEDPRIRPRQPTNAFYVPHALALAEEYGYIFVADRENGRINCFNSKNGTFHREYKYTDVIGTRIFSVAYANDKIYLVNGPSFNIFNQNIHIAGFVIDINNGKIISTFNPSKDMRNPHDIALSNDAKFIYVAELDPHKIYRFFNDVNSTVEKQHQHRRKGDSSSHLDEKNSLETTEDFQKDTFPIGDITNGSIDYSLRKEVTATTIILSLITATVLLVALCIAIAAIVARCRKRGCLLNVRRGGGGGGGGGMPRWESDRRENFKLSKFLENRKIKGKKFFEKRPNTRDFSKLNTEPETSDDDNNLTKII